MKQICQIPLFQTEKGRLKRQLLWKKGMSRSVSNYDCQLGDLYLCTNILYDDKATPDASIKLFSFNRNHSCGGWPFHQHLQQI